MSNSITKFQELLSKIFRFDSSDLDFGIYRIINYKRKWVDDFITKTIPNKVNEAFSRFPSTPEIEALKDGIFADLHTFFNRYYEEGDFIPKRRYKMKKLTYAIPYNGEEVKLHYATSDMYYIKTSEFFRDYLFYPSPTHPFKVIFKIEQATTEVASNKATQDRYFILADENPVDYDEKTQTLTIKFNYTHLTKEHLEKYKSALAQDVNTENNDEDNDNESESETKQKKVKQESINNITYTEIIKELESKDKSLIHFLSKNNDSGIPVLLYHLNRCLLYTSDAADE